MSAHEPAEESPIQLALESVNAGYVAQLYEQYRRDPGSVDQEWRSLFESGAAGFSTAAASRPGQAATPAAPAPAGAGAPPDSNPTNGTGESGRSGASTTTQPAVAVNPVGQRTGGATPLRGPAARLATNMTASLAVPTATSFRDTDVSVLEARRRELNTQLDPRKVSFTHLVGFAIVQAAGTHPEMTHFFRETDGVAHRVDPGAVNLGLAVDVERGGGHFLVVPVIRGAEAMDFAAFHARYEELVEKARANHLSPDDFTGATITLTNPGTLGTTASVPRLMPNQGTIVATGSIRSVGEQRIMTLTSTYDHRIIQGAESGAFLRAIDALLRGDDDFFARVFAAVGATIEERSERGTASRGTASRGAAPAPAAATPAPPARAAAAEEATDAIGPGDLEAVAAGMALVKAYRNFGHMAAHLDPLGSEPPGDPSLDPGPLGLDEARMARIPARLMRIYVPGETLAEALPHLRATYCGSIAYEVEHIGSHQERVWLRHVIESGEHRRPMTANDQRDLLARLTRVEGLERFLHKAYLGQKRFSIEGLDAMVPMIDLIARRAAVIGTGNIVIGMAHRGRLNVMAHVVGVSYEAILSEFEAGRGETELPEPRAAVDDVKYHLGAEAERELEGRRLTVSLSPNPSHLEAVDPVVEGRARAEQTDRSRVEAAIDHSRTLPLLIHGDAAFAAQGVVAETFNLARLPGYATGGTLHIIANNQIGFTTGPREGRSTDYSSDLAKGFDAPIIHVNADDPEACLAAARLAMMYKERFSNDVVIDLVGYRRYGHNEADEPAYTQPLEYEKITHHASVRELYLQRLVAAGIVDQATGEADAKALTRELSGRQAELRRAKEGRGAESQPELDRGADGIAREGVAEPVTSVDAESLRRLNAELNRWPDGFTVSTKLARQLERRSAALDADEGHLEWAQAESLAFASLLCEGTPVRLTGQDTVRGTFSQRHQTIFDARTGEAYTPIRHVSGAAAAFELHNSPLSEYACLGFEYGYAVSAPETLVLWEAQYGDFVNGGEIVIDQFLIAGLAKWRQTSRLTLLLPHGYEGSGPEHSSARLERFLALGAEGNIRVAYPTTAAQYFHVLRRQALHAELRPLVLMTPKSLLRLPAASSTLHDLTDGAFQAVLDDPMQADADPAAVRRLVLCSGKVYFDIAGADARSSAADLAVIRVEQLYPFPSEELRRVLARYPAVERVSWVQEEPRNMGARKFVLPRIRHLVPYNVPLSDVSRPERSRPAEGYPAAHQAEQARIVRDALSE
ncbi:MAG: multifunctional oxoglutarate decarboxylase/oxoglutarate dehydrogenase thiamine pyrophosphate-binding subunit/dihydrolipoyllysine-residue succinyltransferase subunit [Chloroflexi bacterium]|nr:MAG: multifunctional oxoglutarate decarboxylase/oxoglutarate dehydrogenase thiamine pyrophosphate-binding subunit/dihydrolipoyllysine-residue succinyltransferase subunit [Chloroflexota bacterium]